MVGLGKMLVGAMPWLIIAGLLSAALYVDPVSISDPVKPRPIMPQDRFYDAASDSAGHVWMVGNLGKALRSDDGGHTWQNKSPSVNETLQSIAVWDTETVVAVGDGGTVVVTRDGGERWQTVEVPISEIANTLIRVRIIEDRAWVVGEFGALLVSDNRGESWSQVVDAEDSTWHDIAGIGGTLLVVGEFGRILRSENGGETWGAVTPLVEETLNAVHLREDGVGLAVGLAGVILMTKDHGETWEVGTVVSAEHLYAIEWDGHRWLALGANGAVLQTASEMVNWTATRVSEDNFAWRTAALPTERGWFLVGADQGFLNDGRWQPLN